MLNIKTLIKMITKYGKNVYYEEINDYHLFTNNQILVFIKDGYDKELCKTCLEEMCCYAYQLLTVERI